MNAREFLQLALTLADGTRAAEARTAISRAYYAVYHVGAELLEQMGFSVSEGPAGHGEVRHYLANCGDSEVMDVAFQMAGLHRNRLHADYRLDRTDVERQGVAQALVNQASEMIVILDRCRHEPRRTQIINAIRDWEQKMSGT